MWLDDAVCLDFCYKKYDCISSDRSANLANLQIKTHNDAIDRNVSKRMKVDGMCCFGSFGTECECSVLTMYM